MPLSLSVQLSVSDGIVFIFHYLQDAQQSQRDRAAGCISIGQKWKTGTGRQYFTDIVGLSLTTVT